LLAIQHHPSDPGELIGHRYSNHIGVSSRFQIRPPGTEGMVIASHAMLYGTAAMNEKPSKIFIAVLADPEKFRFTAGRALFWDESQPGGELTPAREGRTISNRRDGGRCNQYADTR
jgi:hypothetical protein